MKLFVYSGDGAQLVGQAFTQARHGRLTTTFTYDAAYLTAPRAYPVDPELPLADGLWPVTAALPRSFLDAAPDRWGRNLIDHRVTADARRLGTPAPTLTDADYLLGVSDKPRQGELRFKRSPDGQFEHPADDVPPLVGLPDLQAAAASVVAGDASADQAVNTLLDVGSASLGGARPKASVYDGDRLMIAKFAHAHDKWDVMAWEATALDLAQAAGVDVPRHALRQIGGEAVLLTQRFDRDGDQRIGYMSAMTLCQADDGEQRDYLDVAERLAAVSADSAADLDQLWRRIAFGIAMNNTDDHLRNHGLLRQRKGWRLSPAFDINPNPVPDAAHATATGGATRGSETASALVDVAPLFGLTQTRVSQVLAEILDATSAWRATAGANGISATEAGRFADAITAGRDALAAVSC